MARVGIKDIAAHVGVSTATVSNAMRNPGRVSKTTRTNVLAAIKEMGYIPNKLGVGLRTSKSYNILVIIPNVADSFNSEIIKAIESVAYEHGYSVLLGDTQGSHSRELEYGAMADSSQADGIIFFSHRLPFDIGKDKSLLADLPPMVNSCELAHIEGIPTVTIDNVKAAEDATQHLIDCGHRNIAAITGNMDNPSSQDRLQGFRQALEKASLPCHEHNIVYADYTAEDGEAAVKQLLVHKDRPTAIFCFSDEIALGCIFSLREKGYAVPEDISVIGFDDIPFAKYLASPLTTISQPTREIGVTCAKFLLDLMSGNEIKNKKLILKHELVVRSSTKKIK